MEQQKLLGSHMKPGHAEDVCECQSWLTYLLTTVPVVAPFRAFRLQDSFFTQKPFLSEFSVVSVTRSPARSLSPVNFVKCSFFICEITGGINF